MMSYLTCFVTVFIGENINLDMFIELQTFKYMYSLRPVPRLRSGRGHAPRPRPGRDAVLHRQLHHLRGLPAGGAGAGLPGPVRRLHHGDRAER